MKLSIRIKLFIGMSCLVLLYSGISWLLNSQYLETYYISQKKSLLIENSQLIDDQYTGDPYEIAAALEKIETTYGVIVHIIGSDGRVKYSSIHRLLNGNPFYPDDNATSRSQQSPFLLRTQEQINEKLTLEIVKDPVLNRDFITAERQLNTNDILTLRVPLAAIADSVAIANHFMIFNSVIVILLGSIWTVYYSKRFTQPILELNAIAHQMANLNFTKKSQNTSGDEIGDLGTSLNYLSNQLESAINELNVKNEQLIADIQRERQLDQMRKDFVSSVSHELKTPLSLILGYAEGLRENVNEDEANKNFYCDVIIDEASKMDKLVKDLLNLSQLESTRYQLHKHKFNLAALLTQVLKKYQTIFKENKLQIATDFDKTLLVYADKTKIEQVLVNLLNNALQHVNDKKSIYIAVKAREKKFRVYITNSGPQIPQACLDKIWTSFFKVDPARTREDGRVGLGLAIVRAIQERHQNIFGVKNVEGGVQFWFDIDQAH